MAQNQVPCAARACGASVAEGLTFDEPPEGNCFSQYTVKLRVQLYREHPPLFVNLAIGQQAVAQLPSIKQMECELGVEEGTQTGIYQISL